MPIYGLDSAHFVFAPRLTWEAVLENTAVKLDLLNDVDMLLVVEKGIRGKLCCVVH